MLFQNSLLADTYPYYGIDKWLRDVGRYDADGLSMPMDAYLQDNKVIVHLDLPGVSTDSIDINLDRNVLTVSAQRPQPSKPEEQAYVLERAKGHFRRQVHLGDGLDSSNIIADYTDGVLTLQIAVSEKAQPRKISVNKSVTPAQA